MGDASDSLLNRPLPACTSTWRGDRTTAGTSICERLSAGHQCDLRAGQAEARPKVTTWIDSIDENLLYLTGTALDQNLTLVTRNTKDIAVTGVPVFNPWRD